tara:strand:+ start:349 stop:651 length:303 start_codon:yes stop_codon:yes gene_type:complete
MYYRILKLRPTLTGSEFLIADNSDGNGPFIAAWTSSESQPTDAEIASVDDSPPVAIAAQLEIERLEAEVTPRHFREAILGTDGGWLAAQDALIAAERAKL